MYMRDDYMRTAFNMFDQDGSGSIDKKELIQILEGEEMKGICNSNMLTKYIQEVDKDGDGEIDFDEF
jgi:calcium-dependent protein kinase